MNNNQLNVDNNQNINEDEDHSNKLVNDRK